MPIAIPIALAITAGASTATSVYSAKRAGKTNDRMIDATARDNAANAAIERERTGIEREKVASDKAAADADRAQKADLYQKALDADAARWKSYVDINTPQWQASNGLMGSLFGLAGGGARSGGMPTSTPPYAPAASMSPSARSGSSPGAPVAAPSAYRTVQAQQPQGADPLASLQNIMAMSRMGAGPRSASVGDTGGAYQPYAPLSDLSALMARPA